MKTLEHDYRYISHEDLRLTFNTFSEEDVNTYSQLLFDVSRNQVVVGARDHLYRLSLAHLEPIESVVWKSTEDTAATCADKGQTEMDCHNYPKVLLTNGRQLLACGTNSFSPICTWREIDNMTVITDTMNGVAKCPFNPASNISAILTDKGDLCVGGPTNFGGTDYAIYRSSSGTGTSTQPGIRTKQYDSMWLNEPQFVGSFETDKHFYFLFREAAVEYINCGKIIYSRIARVCKNDPGGGTAHPMLRDNWTTFIKARLNCSVAGDYPFYYDEIQSATFVAGENVVYATFTTPENGIAAAAICAFNLTSIDAAFAGPFKYQEHTGSAWSRYQSSNARNHIDCPGQVDSISEHHSHMGRHHVLMDNAVQAIRAVGHVRSPQRPLYETALERLTHITVDVLATSNHIAQHVIYVAASSGEIRKLTLLPSTMETCLVEVWQPVPLISAISTGPRDTVLFMQYLKDTNSIYVGTDRAVLRIPAAHCGRHVSTRTCLEAMDPYCGWNMLENACTTAPDNDPLADHWTQDMQSCPVLDSAVDGGWSGWSIWAPCAKVADSNNPELVTNQYMSHHMHSTSAIDQCQCQTRQCNNPQPQNGGATCLGINMRVSNCTVHGDWTPYSAYSECSATCGNAVKTRYRTCSNPTPEYGGRVCVGRDRDEVICMNNPPCPIPSNDEDKPQWSTWGDWSVCSAKCGGGFRSRRRYCRQYPSLQFNITYDSAEQCVGNSEQYEECSKHQCPYKRVAQWSPWQNTGFGTQRRQRVHCNANLNKTTGLEARISFGKPEERQCPSGIYCGDGSTMEASDRTTHDVVINSWQQWTPWSSCSVSCGKGEIVRVRVCSNSNGCGESRELVEVQRKPCNVRGRNCQQLNSLQAAETWGCWSDWSPCSSTCGWGIQNRHRSCLADDSANCYGESVQEQPCQIDECSSMLGWNPWTAWSECDNNNEQHRKRSCRSENPGSEMCAGATNETRICLNQNSINNDIDGYKIRMAGAHIGCSDSVGMILLLLVVGFAGGCLISLAGFFIHNRRQRSNRIPSSPHYMPVNAKQNPYTTVPYKDTSKKNSSSNGCTPSNASPLMAISPPKMNNITASPGGGNGTIRSLKNFDSDCNTFKRNKSNHNSRYQDDKCLYE